MPARSSRVGHRRRPRRDALGGLQVGTLVTGVTYRHPAVLAKMAVTLDHVSGGRAILGIGAAWHESEHRMFGIEFPSVGERMTRLDETLTAFRLLCDDRRSGRLRRLDGAARPAPCSSRSRCARSPAARPRRRRAAVG